MQLYTFDKFEHFSFFLIIANIYHFLRFIFTDERRKLKQKSILEKCKNVDNIKNENKIKLPCIIYLFVSTRFEVRIR